MGTTWDERATKFYTFRAYGYLKLYLISLWASRAIITKIEVYDDFIFLYYAKLPDLLSLLDKDL